MVLSGANTYTGATTISTGTVNIQHATALGTTAGATTVASGAALQIQGGISIGEAITITGTGGGNGAIRSISGSNTISGLVTLSTSTSQIQADADTLKLTAANSITATNIGLTISGSGNITISGTITTGSGTLTKNGTGTLILSGANTYTGATTISAGLVNISNATALGTTGGTTTVSNGASLEVQGNITVAEAITISGSGFSNNGVLRNVSGKNTISGTITLGAISQIQSDADTLKLTAANSINATINGFNLTFDGVGHFVINGTITTRTGGLLKTGAGSISLGAVNTYTGETNLTSGVLYLGINNPISNSSIFTFNGGKLVTNGKNLTVGAINVYDNSIIELLNSRHTISFSSLGVVDLRNLTITGWQGNAYTNNNANLGSSGNSGSIIIGSSLTFKELDQIQFINPTDGLYYNAMQLSPSNEIIPINSKLAFSNIRIATSATTTLSGVAPISEGGTWSNLVSGAYTFTPNSNNATILDVEISNRMNGIGYTSGNVVINTACALCTQSGSVYFDDVLNSNSVSTTGTIKTLTINANKNISVDFAINFNRGSSVAFANSLTLSAGGDITTNASITATTSGANSFAGTIGITAIGGINITQPITVTNSSSSGTGGAINISGNGVTIAGALGTNATSNTSGTGGSIIITGNTVSISGAIDTKAAGTTSGTGGNINITATNGLNLTSSTITANGLTNDGTLTINTNATSITTGGVNNGQTAGVISGGTNIVKTGTGAFFLNGANTYTGSTTISDGILKIGSATVIPTTSPVILNGQLDINGFSPTFASLAGTSTSAKLTNSVASSTVTITINQTTSTSYSGIIQNGSGTTLGLIKSGAGILTLSGANTYTGATNITGGAISIEHENALGSIVGGTTVASGAELQLAGSGKRFASEPIHIQGNGISGTGAALHNVTGKNTWVGAVILDGASSIFSDLGDTLIIANVDSVTGTNTNLIVGGDGVLIDSASFKIGTGSLTKSGTGLVSLNVQNTYTGPTTVSAGILKLGVVSSISGSTSLANNLTTVNSVLDLNGSSLTIDTLIGSINGIINSGISGNVNLSLLRGNYAGAIRDSLGVVSVIKSGTVNNLLILSGTNSYSGATSINNGVINIRNGSALGTNAGTTTIASGAALQVQGNISSSEPISAAGTGIANDGVIRNISGVNTIAGLVSLTAASQLQSDGTTTDTLKLTGSNAITGTNIGITFNGTGNILVGGTITTGSGTITKTGTGTTVLAGANTFTGAVNINQGALNIQHAAALGNVTTGTTVSAGAELQIQGGLSFNAEPLFINGSGINNGTGAINNTSGNNTFSGPITLNSASTIISSGTLTLTATTAITGSYGLTFGGTGGIILTGILSIGNNTVTKNDAGAVNLNGVNAFTGLTTINQGTLRMGAIPAIPVTNDISISAGGTLDLYGKSNTIASLNGAGIVTNSGIAATLIISGTSNSIYSGTIIDGTGVVSITKSGTSTLTLSGANTYTGNTTLSAGALKLGANNVLPNASSFVFNGGTFYNNGFSDTTGVLSITKTSSIILDTTTNSSLSFSNIGAIGSGSLYLNVYGYMGSSAATALDKNGALKTNSTSFIRATGTLGSTVIGGLTANGKIITSTASNPNNILNGIYINTPNITNANLAQIRYWVGDNTQPTPVFGFHNVTQSSYKILPVL